MTFFLFGELLGCYRELLFEACWNGKFRRLRVLKFERFSGGKTPLRRLVLLFVLVIIAE
jgi:hypothetical protein